MNDKILLIIPAYNEEKSIEKTVQTVINSGYDYIVINDGSSDSTEKILTEKRYKHISLISNLGIGGAVQTGYKYAFYNDYDIAIQFDADGQHDIKYVNNLIEPIKKKQANLVIGSCFIDKTNKNLRSSKFRRAGIHFLSNFIKIFSGKRIHDPTSGFRAADKTVIARFAKEYPLEYPEPVSNFELLKDPNFTIQETPVTMNKRTGGKSSIRSWKNIYAAFNVMISILTSSTKDKNE